MKNRIDKQNKCNLHKLADLRNRLTLDDLCTRESTVLFKRVFYYYLILS